VTTDLAVHFHADFAAVCNHPDERAQFADDYAYLQSQLRQHSSDREFSCGQATNAVHRRRPAPCGSV